MCEKETKGKAKRWTVTVLLLAVVGVGGAPRAGTSGPGTDASVHTVELGERMYREGLLPSGEPMEGLVQGDIPVVGPALTCSNCHVRSGLGSVEGGVVTTPTTGARLFQPYSDPADLPLATRERRRMASVAPPPRPAYTEATLAAALSGGLDPTGRELNAVMPRYNLDDASMATLVAYLKTLSSAPSPGVTETEIRFATVIHKDVAPEDRRALLGPLESYIKNRNSLIGGMKDATRYRKNPSRYNMAQMGFNPSTYRSLSLALWELSGPPSEWRRQLEEYAKKEPVFALLGGLTVGEWGPIHEFCEEHRLPCLFPMTDLPVVSGKDWYTLYFSKGFYQEGEAAARYLSEAEGMPQNARVVQVYRDSEQGRALAAGFAETWKKRGRAPALDRVLGETQPMTPDALTNLAAEGKPDAILVWLGPESFPALEALAAQPDRPRFLFASGRALADRLGQLPESARSTVYVTYPYRPPRDQNVETGVAGVWLKSYNLQQDSHRIGTRAYALLMLVGEVLMEMKDNWYRDYLLDLVDLMMQDDSMGPDFPRLSFGPGQRYASKGCYIVQLAPGPDPLLVKKSDWVIH